MADPGSRVWRERSAGRGSCRGAFQGRAKVVGFASFLVDPFRAATRKGLRLSAGPRSSGVEHFLGKEEVVGSKPTVGSKERDGPHLPEVKHTHGQGEV